jgi:hypothetical protein
LIDQSTEEGYEIDWNAYDGIKKVTSAAASDYGSEGTTREQKVARRARLFAANKTRK